MTHMTKDWEAELDRVTGVENVFNPGHISAVEEVVRLRQRLAEVRTFVRKFPVIPLLRGTGSVEDRAMELQGKTCAAIDIILEGDDG